MEKRFKILVTSYHWSCGDGCCLDSGYKLSVWDGEAKEYILNDDEWEYHRDRDYREEQGVEAVSKALGREATVADYWVDDDYEESERRDDEQEA